MPAMNCWPLAFELMPTIPTFHHSASPFCWTALERASGLVAVAAAWRRCLGEHYPIFARAFLQVRRETAAVYPCDNCACFHEVIISHPGYDSASSLASASITAHCRCEPLACYPIALAPADIELHELSWSKLARALCRAFDLHAQTVELGLYQTRQIGAWSAQAVPVILTIQHDRHELLAVIAQLALRLRRPFILVSPTGQNLDSAGTISGRLELIRARTGIAPDALRRVSSHLSRLEDGLADSRAKHIQRGGAME